MVLVVLVVVVVAPPPSEVLFRLRPAILIGAALSGAAPSLLVLALLRLLSEQSPGVNAACAPGDQHSRRRPLGARRWSVPPLRPAATYYCKGVVRSAVQAGSGWILASSTAQQTGEDDIRSRPAQDFFLDELTVL